MEDEELPGAQFWLPPEFFTDDCFPEKGRREAQAAECPTLDDDGVHSGTGDPFFPMEFPYQWGDGSGLSSPVDSVTGTESSDEEDRMAGLIRQMSRHSLSGPDGDGSPSSLSAEKRKAVSVEGNSPQSTLSELRTCKSSSWESSSAPSLVSSPLSSHLDRDKGEDAWIDTLDAAAPRQVVHKEQRRESDHPPEQGVRSLLAAPAQNPSPSAPVSFAKEAAAGYFAGPSSTQQLQGNQQLQHPHQAKVEQKDGAAWSWQKRAKGVAGPAGSRPLRPLGLPAAAWPPLQQPPPQTQPPPHAGSGMRAVFLSPPSRKHPGGTGVFLPRTAGIATEPRKKPPCATVLLPAKVVQALNLDLNEIGARPRFPGAFVLDRETMAARSSAKRRARQAPADRDGRDVRLPPEWTY